MSPDNVTRARPVGHKSPTLAGLLSSLPGLGQIYIGHYTRGFVHVLVVAFTITLLNRMELSGSDGLEALFGLFLAFFWLYNIIDAVRLTHFYNEALDGAEADELRRRMVLPHRGGSIPGGIFLLAFGILVFAHTTFGVSLRWLEDWWPVLPIAGGVYLIAKGIRERRRGD